VLAREDVGSVDGGLGGLAAATADDTAEVDEEEENRG
jgi:hypothetical protein